MSTHFLSQNDYETLLVEIFRQAGIGPTEARQLIGLRWPLIGYAGMLAEGVGRGFWFDRSDLGDFIAWCREQFGDDCVPNDAEDRLDTMVCVPTLFDAFQNWLEQNDRAKPTLRGEIMGTPEGEAWMNAALKSSHFGDN